MSGELGRTKALVTLHSLAWEVSRVVFRDLTLLLGKVWGPPSSFLGSSRDLRTLLPCLQHGASLTITPTCVTLSKVLYFCASVFSSLKGE